MKGSFNNVIIVVIRITTILIWEVCKWENGIMK